MTVENTTARWRYTGDGVGVSFAYTNKITAAGDLKVYLDGVLQGSGYAVSNVGVKTGGNVVFDVAPALDVRIDFLRDVPVTQPAKFPVGGPFPSALAEVALDRAILALQDLKALANLSLRLGVDADTAAVSLEIPTLVPDRVLAARSDGLGVEWVVGTPSPQALIVAVGDETTVITIGTGKVTFRMPHAFTLSSVKASLTTAGTTLTTVDINKGGATILSTKLTIDANETTSASAAAAAVISDTALAADAEVTIDIDGAGTDAAGLKITLIGKAA